MAYLSVDKHIYQPCNTADFVNYHYHSKTRLPIENAFEKHETNHFLYIVYLHSMESFHHGHIEHTIAELGHWLSYVKMWIYYVTHRTASWTNC